MTIASDPSRPAAASALISTQVLVWCRPMEDSVLPMLHTSARCQPREAFLPPQMRAPYEETDEGGELTAAGSRVWEEGSAYSWALPHGGAR